jgi:hypothetical protein
MTPREQLLKMQRIILRQLKREVARLQGNAPPEIERYYQAYKREFRNYQKISSKTELLKQVKQSDIIFGADFHPFAQSQRTHLRILRELVKYSRPVVLAIEAVDSKCQDAVNSYLDGEFDDATFLRKINYNQSWGFPWENYKVLFEFAKNYDLPLYGINESLLDKQNQDLALRDAYSAERISGLRKEFPNAIIYVIYGDLHLASSHLPRLTKKLLGRADHTRFLTVFQDSETLYWRLAKKRLEERVDVLKLRGDAFCVVNSPPWIKWQAYLDFLDDADGDYSDQILEYIKIVRKVWKVDKVQSDFHVYTRGDVRLAQHVSRIIPKKELLRVVNLIKHEKSFFIPNPNLFYFYSVGINQMVALVGQFIHSKLRQEKNTHLQFPRDFVPNIWIEAVGFFASKLINNRRKSSELSELPSKSKTTLIVLEQRLHEQVAIQTRTAMKAVRRHPSRKSENYFDAARVVGSLLGTRMYLAYQTGDLDLSKLHRWLKSPVEAGPKFSKFYISILSDLKNISVVEGHNERL